MLLILLFTSQLVFSSSTKTSKGFVVALQLQESVQQLAEYCPESKDTYLCRMQVQRDCENGSGKQPCVLLNQLVENEAAFIKFEKMKAIPESANLGQEKSREGCGPQPAPTLAPVMVYEKLNVHRGSDVVEDGKPYSEQSQAIDILVNKINQEKVPLHCEKDSQCHSMSYGHIWECQKIVGLFIYSDINGTPPVFELIQQFNSLDASLNSKLHGFSNCVMSLQLAQLACKNKICALP